MSKPWGRWPQIFVAFSEKLKFKDHSHFQSPQNSTESGLLQLYRTENGLKANLGAAEGLKIGDRNHGHFAVHDFTKNISYWILDNVKSCWSNVCFFCYRRNNDSRAVNRPENRELKNRRDSDRNRDRNRDRDRDQDKRHERDEKRKDVDRKPKSDQRKKQMKIKKVSSVKIWDFWVGHKILKKIFAVLLTRASCSVRATAYLSKSRRFFFFFFF